MISSLILGPRKAAASEAFASLSYNCYLTIGKKNRSDTMSCLKEKKGKNYERNSRFHNRFERR